MKQDPGRNGGAAAIAADDDRPLMFHLWHLVKTARDSAESEYSSIVPLVALDRQMLLILDRGWGETFPALCALIGKDKAQVSRALARLQAAGFVSRARPRGPLTLTDSGHDITRRLMAMAEDRNGRLLAGLDETAVAAVHRITETLIREANALYEAERALVADATTARPPRDWFDGIDPDVPPPIADGLILPRLIALLAYAQRSLSLSAKRLVALPAFDTLVLSFVVARAPLAQAALVEMLIRDQSQAARTIRRLIADGLIERLPESSRRTILLAPTPAGRAADAVMAAEVSRRDARLGAALSRGDLADYRQALRQMAANAAAMAEA